MSLLCLGVLCLQALCEPYSRWASASIYCNFYPDVGLFILDLGKRRWFAETQLKPIISTLSQQQVAGENNQLGAINLPLQEGRLCPFSGLLPLTLKSSIIHHYRPVPLLEAIVSFHLHSPWGPQSTNRRNKTWRGCPGPMPGGHKAKCLGIRHDSQHLPHAADKLILLSLSHRELRFT